MVFTSTAHEFTLPIGYMAEDGTLHKQGFMRTASLADELLPKRDHRTRSNPSYLDLLILSRVVTKLGTQGEINTSAIERIFAWDFSYLTELYGQINERVPTLGETCPKCEHKFEVETKLPPDKTEYEFTLPRGYLDPEGEVHKQGVMRLATVGDEVLPLEDIRVKSNPGYLIVILLSRVITKLGTVEKIDTRVVESLFTADLAYLQGLYSAINKRRPAVEATCPKCQHKFKVEEKTAKLLKDEAGRHF